MPKYQKYARARSVYIYPHKHCPHCGHMMPEDSEYCSEACRLAEEEKEKKRKRSIITFVAAYVVIIVAFVGFLVWAARTS